jgi:hypothetical protein
MESLNIQVNTSKEKWLDNIRVNLSRKIPVIERHYKPIKQRVNVVAGGNSVPKYLKILKKRQKKGDLIFCVNGAHDFLIKNGITPDAMVMLDAKPEALRFVKNSKDNIVYYIASNCDPSLFEELKDRHIVMWHASNWGDEDDAVLGNRMKIGGGCTAALRVLNIAHVLGFRDIHYYGLDSCIIDGKNHAYDMPERDSFLYIDCGEKHFKTTPDMLEQVLSFKKVYNSVGHLFKLTVHGEGIIAYILSKGSEPNHCEIRREPINE